MAGKKPSGGGGYGRAMGGKGRGPQAGPAYGQGGRFGGMVKQGMQDFRQAAPAMAQAAQQGNWGGVGEAAAPMINNAREAMAGQQPSMGGEPFPSPNQAAGRPEIAQARQDAMLGMQGEDPAVMQANARKGYGQSRMMGNVGNGMANNQEQLALADALQNRQGAEQQALAGRAGMYGGRA